MEEKNRSWRRLAILAATAGLIASACSGGATPSPSGSAPVGSPAGSTGPAPSGGQVGGTVTVIGTWGGSEQESFLAMVAPFEESTGIDVQFTGTRDINTVLSTGVASGILPDVAGLPGPGQMREWAQAGALKPLDDVLDTATYTAETAPALVELGTVDGSISGVFIKAAVKGLIWYNPANFQQDPPATWEELQNIAVDATGQKWCVGLESDAASGWPGTDWIEDFVLRQSGPDVYDAWVAGTQKWTSPEIKQAFEAFGDVIDESFGGSDGVLATNFGAAGNPLFTDPPGCLFHHQASFITDFFKEQGGAADGDFAFFPMPDINPSFEGALTGAGDLFGMFNDTPQARALMAYLVTADAQKIWVERGGALSANTTVTEYPDEASTQSAALLAEAGVFRFDASDLMPVAMNDAFWGAILDFTKDQSQLDTILGELDTIQTSAYGG